jgi:hypothetical protein
MSDIPDAIARAVEVRAHGGSWPKCAAAAEWEEYGLRRWIRANTALWFREVGRARRESRDEACDETVVVLRNKLRADEDKTSLEAAKIIGGHFNPAKHRRPKAPPAKDVPSQFLEYLDAIPEGQATRVDRHVQACEDESRTAPRRGRRRPD